MSHNNKHTIRRAKPLLGTIVELSLLSSSHAEDALASLIARSFQRISEIQRAMSFFDSSSDVSRLNNSSLNQRVPVFPETAQLLKLASELYRESEGAFDVMYQGRQQFPDVEIIFHETGHVSRTAPAKVDLGGIAKGYAVDEAARILQADGQTSGVINAGGDLRFFGPEKFPLSIRSPYNDGRYFNLGAFSECAVATSLFYRGSEPSSISVLAPACVLADSLTKVVFGLDPMRRDAVLSKYGASYLEIDSKTMGAYDGGQYDCAG